MWAYKKYAELKESGRLPAQAERQSLGELEIVNDLEAPVFEKYILLPVMKSWLRQQAGVESAFMTGSGSTMVAVMEARVTEDLLLSLKTKIAEEYGETCWTCVTTFSMPR